MAPDAPARSRPSIEPERPSRRMPNDPSPARTAVPMIAVHRGLGVESLHHGMAVVADANGRVVAHWGDVDQAVFPRSAIKPLQALALVETGAAAAFDVTDAELALACASHAGMALHTEAVAGWLDRLGLGPAALACGAHPPNDPETAAALIGAGAAPSALHNNCSGKHAGMLTTARHKGESLDGYTEIAHPVQQRILGILEMMTAQNLGSAPVGRDGCSVPTVAVPLGGLAVAMAALGDRRNLPDRRAEAAARVCRAWAAHPDLIHGPGYTDSRLNRAFAGEILVKRGAEGCYCAAMPAARLGLALKIADGASRAAAPALIAILAQLGLLAAPAQAAVADLAEPRLVNHRGLEVGRIAPAAGFPE